MMDTMKIRFFEKKSQLEVWFSSLDINSLDIIRYASFFTVGFLGGLLFKRWSKYIILIVVSVVMMLAILQGFSIITINFIRIQRLTGFSNITNLQSMFLVLVDITKKYAWEFGCSGIGFIFGFKTG
ncbi:hypothetical protein KBC04_02195 [Candidatus Babeliales bacterium]|nr:hypothetical protein [Candidatus Babeliales bacterium]MBP9843781.1 hypothetical protein [Candidatus Babeliales bacterium]